MVGGLVRGLDNENALRFAFLLSTPVILAAGVLKVPDLTGSLCNAIRGQVIAGSAAAVVSSLGAVIFLTRYFKTRTLVPFAVYCLAFGRSRPSDSGSSKRARCPPGEHPPNVRANRRRQPSTARAGLLDAGAVHGNTAVLVLVVVAGLAFDFTNGFTTRPTHGHLDRHRRPQAAAGGGPIGVPQPG